MFTTSYESHLNDETISGTILVSVLEPFFLHAIVEIDDIKLNISLTNYVSDYPFGCSYAIDSRNFFYFITLLDFDRGYRWDPIMEIDESIHHDELKFTDFSEKKRAALVAAIRELISLVESPRIDAPQVAYIEVTPQ